MLENIAIYISQYMHLKKRFRLFGDKSVPKGLAKLGNIVAETLLQMQMIPNLAARETCAEETNFAAWKQKMFLPWS